MVEILINRANNYPKIPQSLDLLNILQVSQYLASKLALDELLANMMAIFLEVSTAEKGYLILNQNEQWVIEASGEFTSDRVEVLQSISIDNTNLLSSAIANHVINTRNSLVLNNAIAEGDFINDSYVLQQQPKSILCMPLINQEKLVAVLYLENDRTTKIFTLEQLEILNLLCPQGAISLENAQNFAQLQESEKRWVQIIEAIPFGLSAHGKDGKVFYINQTGKRLIGQDIQSELTLQELVESYGICITGTDELYPLEALPLWRVLNGEDTIAEDVEVHRQGAIIPFKMQALPVLDESGNIIYAVNIFQDITEQQAVLSERKRVEAALQESESRYRGIVEDQTELVSRFSPDGTLTFINDAYCRYFGIKKEEIIGKHYAPVIFEEDLEYVEEMVKTITQENPVVIIENRVVVGKEVRWTQWINRAIFNQENQLLELQSVGRDISELKQVEQALRESERRYRQIVETADEGIWVINLEGNTTFANPKMAQMLGYSEEEMLGMPIFAFSNEEGQEIAKNNLQLRRQGIAGKLDFKFRRKDGSELWAIITSSPIMDESGNFTGVLGMITDITQRKEAEDSLHRYERIVATTTDAIALVDRNYKYQMINESFKKWRKKDESEIIGKSVSEIIGAEVFENLVKPLLERCLNGETINYQAWFNYESGESRFLSVNYIPYVEPDCKISGIVISLRDLTELKKAEEELQRSEERYRQIVETSEEGIWIIDLEGNTLFANPKMAQMLGCTVEELLELSMFAFMDEERIKLATKNLERRRIGIQEKHDFKFIRKDGSELWVIISTSPILNKSGESIGALGMLTDITDRKTIEIALREQKELLQTIFDRIPVMLCFYNSQAEVQLANAAIENILGWSLAELKQIDIMAECYPDPDYRASVLEFMMRADGTWKDLQLITRDGTVLETCWANVRLPDGFQVGIGQDITKRKRAEQALEESEERWQLAIRGTNDGIWDWDLRNNQVFFSPRWKEMRGFSEHEISNSLNEWLTRVYPEDVERVMQTLADHFDRKTSLFSVEYRVQCKDNSYIWILDRGQAIWDENGKVVRMAGSETDITQRKQAEEALIKSEHALAEAQRLAHLGSWSFDLSTRKMIWSEEVFRIYGLDSSQGEPTEEQHLQQFHPDDREQLQQSVNLAITEGIPYEHEIRIFLPDGSMRYTLGRGQPVFNEAGEIVGLFGTVQDISDRKQFEEELKQAKQAAEAANHAKSAFLANMSHELRTPLNAVLGFSQLLKNNANLSLEHKRNLDTITRSGEHLLTLINQVLDLSKIEAGRITLNETDFDLYLFLDDLQDLFQLKANNKALQLLFYHSSDLPRYICADEVKLRQVLINMLSNAMKFTSEGRVTMRVFIENDQEVIINDRKYITLYFEIADTGPGIAADELDSIFEAFVQTKAGQQFQEGTGLGLTICRKFVELMGGEITVSSQLGCGTTFRFNILANRVEASCIETEKVTRRPIALAPDQPSYRLLIVDDSVDNRQVLLSLLSPFGFELKEASNGQEAIAIWETWQPNLIFMDMRMPIMNGYEATKHIRSVTKNQGTVIIAVTASSLEEERSIVLAAGCNDFIRKPYKETDIFGALQNYIQVRFIYDEISTTTTTITKSEPEDLILTALESLPTNLVVNFVQALVALDVELIETFITQIRQLNEPLANAIAAYTTNFQYEQLLYLIKSEEGKSE